MATNSSSPPLTRERIVDEAIALLDEEGEGALSMRRLATRLGASTMSTYHYVANKDELVEAVADRLMQGLALPSPTTPWPDAVRSMGWSFHRLVVEHPAAFRVMITGRRPAAMLRAAEHCVAILASQGFDEATALRVLRTFVRYLMGSAQADLGGLGNPVGRWGAVPSDDQFAFGLEALIAGVASMHGMDAGSVTHH